jgi:hypothetical protein
VDITGKRYTARHARLSGELDAEQAALEQAREHVKQTEQSGLPGDGEQALLNHLVAVK